MINKQTCCSLLTVGLLLTASYSPVKAQDKTDNAGKTPSGMEQLIHDYILAHPEVMLESIKQFQQRAQLEQKKKAQEAVASHRADLQGDPASPVLQAAEQPGEPVTVVEFFDYRCGYCKKVDSQVVDLAKKPGVRIIYKDFPILGPESFLAAKAALAAGKQGAYHQFHHALITAATPLSEVLIDQIAADLKLDRQRLKQDMASPEISAEINRTMALAGTLGVQSTPTFVIGNSVFPGALTDEALQAAIAAARGGKVNTAATQAGGI